MKRTDIFVRDGYRCVYCGGVFEPDELSVDHVQPKMRGGDGSGGNVVTACRGCNTAKGGQRLAHYLAATPEARRNFFALARHVWPRHLRAVAEELARRYPDITAAGLGPRVRHVNEEMCQTPRATVPRAGAEGARGRKG